MRREKPLELAGQAVTVRELTVGEVRAWLADAEGQVGRDADGMPDIIGLWLLDECSFGDLKRMSDVSDERLNDLTDSDLRALVDACKDLNPGFFGLRARLTALGKASLESPAAPADSNSMSAA
jgi:hypothetical protein